MSNSKREHWIRIPRIGRWPRVSHRVGKLMSHWILSDSGIPVSATTVQSITNLEKQTDEMKERLEDFEESVKQRWEARSSHIKSADYQLDSDVPKVLVLEQEDDEFKEEFKRIIQPTV